MNNNLMIIQAGDCFFFFTFFNSIINYDVDVPRRILKLFTFSQRRSHQKEKKKKLVILLPSMSTNRWNWRAITVLYFTFLAHHKRRHMSMPCPILHMVCRVCKSWHVLNFTNEKDLCEFLYLLKTNKTNLFYFVLNDSGDSVAFNYLWNNFVDIFHHEGIGI